MCWCKSSACNISLLPLHSCVCFVWRNVTRFWVYFAIEIGWHYKNNNNKCNICRNLSTLNYCIHIYLTTDIITLDNFAAFLVEGLRFSLDGLRFSFSTHVFIVINIQQTDANVSFSWFKFVNTCFILVTRKWNAIEDMDVIRDSRRRGKSIRTALLFGYNALKSISMIISDISLSDWWADL